MHVIFLTTLYCHIHINDFLFIFYFIYLYIYLFIYLFHVFIDFLFYFTEFDSKLQDAILKKEEDLLKENIRVTEETKQGFLNHLATALESQKLEAENVLQTQLKEQVWRIKKNIFISFFCFTLFLYILIFISFFFSLLFFSHSILSK